MSDKTYTSTTYHIFPTINIARVGNAKDYIIGPERPGCGPTEFIDQGKRDEEQPVVQFKDNGLVKPQAARFRIYALTETYTMTPEKSGVEKVEREWCEVESTRGVTIEWSVKLANRKGLGWCIGDGYRPDWFTTRNQCDGKVEIEANGNTRTLLESDLIITQPEMTIEGVKKDAPAKEGGRFKGEKVVLGRLQTDARGRLLVLGGTGKAGFVNNKDGALVQWRGDCHYNNEGWYDDTSDGTVHARIKIGNEIHVARGAARVIVGPPDYAPSPGCRGIITQYDQLRQIAKLGHEDERWGWEGYDELIQELAYPSFTRELYPIIRGARNLYWTIHTVHKNLAQFVSTDWGKLSDNTAAQASLRATTVQQILVLEERLNYLELTAIQKTMLERYEAGDFANDWAQEAGTEDELMKKRLKAKVHEPHSSKPPRGLTRAALEQAMGGGFHPGWEGGKDLTNIDNFVGPFRLRGVPGCFVENMAVPWQADLWGCRTWPNEKMDPEPWWPSHRPDSVLTSKLVKGEDPRFEDFARATNGPQMVSRKALIGDFTLLGFVLPEVETSQESAGVWKIDGELVEKERQVEKKPFGAR